VGPRPGLWDKLTYFPLTLGGGRLVPVSLACAPEESGWRGTGDHGRPGEDHHRRGARSITEAIRFNGLRRPVNDHAEAEEP
jgi:hypothetical protein